MNQSEENALRDIQKLWKRSHDAQSKRNDIYLRIWQRYKGYNPDATDPYRSNLVMPTLYAASETVTPRIAKALFGKRPYIPIKSDKNPDAVKPIELALDTYLYWAKFPVVMRQVLKAIFNFGTAFIEPFPTRKVFTERKMEQSSVFPWTQGLVEREIERFRLDLRLYMPWQVYVEPHMVNMKSPGYAIVVEIVPKSEIQRLIDKGVYNQVDPQLLAGEGDRHDKQFSEEMLKSLGIDTANEDLDYGVLMRFQSKDRYMTCWNGIVILKDSQNPFVHKDINIIRCAWNLDPMLQNSFWGQPEVKAIEGLVDKYDESFNQLFDNGALATQGVIGFKRNAVDDNQLIFVGGAKIPIKDTFSGPIRDAIDTFDTRGLPADAYNIPSVLKGEIDRAFGVQNPDYGEPTEGDQTATEMRIIAGKGDLRNEDRTKMMEAMGLADLADKCTSHMDQYMSITDLIEVVGEENAINIITMNPYMIEGGFDYQFKGSDSFLDDYQKRYDLDKLMNLLQNNPTVKPEGIARLACSRYGLNEQEMNDIVYSDEELMQQAMMQQQMQQQEMENQLQTSAAKTQLNSQNRMQEMMFKQGISSQNASGGGR